MSSHPLENPFNDQKRSSDTPAFFETVLGKKGAEKKSKIPLVEDFDPEDNFIISPEDQKNIEDEKIFREIITRESQALRRFFGREIPVPALPKQATKERILEWRALGLELHYLPPISMAEIKRDPEGKILEVIPIDFPGWKKKPRDWFFEMIKDGSLSFEAAKLPGNWVLVDGRPKPDYGDGNQKYPNDFLGPVLEELNKKGIIKQTSSNGEIFLAIDSRYGLSSDELHTSQVKEAIAQAMNLSEEFVSFPKAIEFNVLGNIFHPEWGGTETSEWFEDRYERFGCLYGGSSNFGGLSYVNWDGNTARRGFAFRIIGRFSN
ncbi:MAG TPA: hypothetical protein VFQ60_00895 [Patescibacteria group bacterium]|nr:hypothetical protein [Patescibacteria group bacterium]